MPRMSRDPDPLPVVEALVDVVHHERAARAALRRMRCEAATVLDGGRVEHRRAWPDRDRDRLRDPSDLDPAVRRAGPAAGDSHRDARHARRGGPSVAARADRSEAGTHAETKGLAAIVRYPAKLRHAG